MAKPHINEICNETCFFFALCILYYCNNLKIMETLCCWTNSPELNYYVYYLKWQFWRYFQYPGHVPQRDAQPIRLQGADTRVLRPKRGGEVLGMWRRRQLRNPTDGWTRSRRRATPLGWQWVPLLLWGDKPLPPYISRSMPFGLGAFSLPSILAHTVLYSFADKITDDCPCIDLIFLIL